MVKPVPKPSCTAARSWRPSEPSLRRKTFNWPAVRDRMRKGMDWSGCLVSLIIPFYGDILGDEADNSYMDNDEITSRTQFPESWLWSDITLPACPPKSPNWWASNALRKQTPTRTLLGFKTDAIALQWNHFLWEKRPLARLNHNLAVYRNQPVENTRWGLSPASVSFHSSDRSLL